jgi:D-alanyl-D-alanine carboxypeptidase
LDHNSALSGYLNAESGHVVTFSILATGFPDSNFGKVYEHVDKALAAIATHG